MTLPPDSHRGGVLTMASVLKVTANGTTTSPVLRGAWVLDRILGTPPPKPPADVRGRRAGHPRRDDDPRATRQAPAAAPTCASCHAKIDPPGFALESFDVIGGWRDYYRSVGKGEPVIVDGRTMRVSRRAGRWTRPTCCRTARSSQNIDEFKQLLLKDKDQLARALAEKLLTYATGAPPG